MTGIRNNCELIARAKTILNIYRFEYLSNIQHVFRMLNLKRCIIPFRIRSHESTQRVTQRQHETREQSHFFAQNVIRQRIPDARESDESDDSVIQQVVHLFIIQQI